MTLHLYKTGQSTPKATIENVVAYTADRVTTADGGIYGPFADGWELSALPDCSERLRSDWRSSHPAEEARIAILETAMKRVLKLFGESTE